MKSRLLAISVLSAVILFGGIAFAERAEAGDYLPAGTYDKSKYTMQVNSDGDYRVTYKDGDTDKVLTSGVALHEGHEACYRGDFQGNLWTVDDSGSGDCAQYPRATVRGTRLIIENLGGYQPLGGVWIKR